MKVRYDKDDDVLMIEFNDKPIDYAEQSGDIIMHFSPKREAVLMEVLNASEFLLLATSKFPKDIRQQFAAA